MKKISFLLAFALVISLFSVPGVSAAEGDFTYFYDFDGYTATSGSGVTPDSTWTYYQNGSAFAGEDDTFKLNWSGTPAIKFGRNVGVVSVADSIHLGFKAKAVSSGFNIVGIKGNITNDTTTIVMNNQPRYQLVNISNAGLKWRSEASDSGSWEYTSSFDGTQWHRYDMVRNAQGKWSYYVDGINVSGSNTTSERAWGGFGGNYMAHIVFYGQGSGGYLDDLSITIEQGSLTGMQMIRPDDNRIERENGTIKINLTEPVLASELVPENITVINTETMEEVTGFTVTPDVIDTSASAFTVDFTETLVSGTHTIALSRDILGMVTGTAAKNDVSFKPDFKKTNGVIHPEAQSVKFFNYNGEEVELGEKISPGIVEIEVVFNTIIGLTEETVGDYINLTDDGKPVEGMEYSIETVDEANVVRIEIPDMLQPAGNYRFVVSAGIPAAENAEVTSEADDVYTFTTAIGGEEANINGVVKNDVDVETKEYSFRFAKNTDDVVKVVALAAAYKTVTDADGKEFEEMLECKYIPVVLGSDDKGVINFGDIFETDLTEAGVSVRTYLLDYPSLLPSDL